MVKSKMMIGLPIFTFAEGKEAGKVESIIINTQRARMAALVMEDPSKLVSYSSIKSIGEDAIIIDSLEQVQDISANKQLQEWKDVEIVNAKVVTTSGKLIGKVLDYFIDPVSGKVTGCEVEALNRPEKTLFISTESVVTFGKDALIIINEREIKAPREVLAEEIEREERLEEVPSLEEEVMEEEKEEEALIKEAVEEEGVAKTILDKYQHDFLVGKIAKKDLVADDGSVIVRSGEKIDEETIKKAKEANKYLELGFYIQSN